MLKKLKDGGMVVIDKSHKALYCTPISCVEYFNAIALTGFALVFYLFVLFHHITTLSNTSSKKVVCFLLPKIYVDITLETW